MYYYLKRGKMKELLTLSKILSDENRLKIITLILRDKKVCVCEICDTLELSQPLVSRHLKKMKEAGVLVAYKDKKWVIYSLIRTPHPFLLTLCKELKKDFSMIPLLCVCSTK